MKKVKNAIQTALFIIALTALISALASVLFGCKEPGHTVKTKPMAYKLPKHH